MKDTKQDYRFDYEWPYEGSGNVFRQAKLTEWVDKIAYRILVRESKYGEETILSILFYSCAAKAIYNTRRALLHSQGKAKVRKS